MSRSDTSLAIREPGRHRGKQVIFGFDGSVAADLAEYVQHLSAYGIAVPAVNVEEPEALTSAQRVCERVQQSPRRVGVLFCESGLLSAMAANKFRGIYAARCLSVADAVEARRTLNANVLCLAATTGVDENRRILEAFMDTAYEGAGQDQLAYVTCLELEADPLRVAK